MRLIAASRTACTHASSASCEASMTLMSFSWACPRMYARWRACSSSMCGKFTENPDCTMLKMNRFGKPRTCMPWKVDVPSAHFSLSVIPSRPCSSQPARAGERGAHLEPGREDEAVDFVLDAVRDDAVLGEALDALARSCRRA